MASKKLIKKRKNAVGVYLQRFFAVKVELWI